MASSPKLAREILGAAKAAPGDSPSFSEAAAKDLLDAIKADDGRKAAAAIRALAQLSADE